jgi:Fic family protein
MYMVQIADAQALESRLQSLRTDTWRTITLIDECKGQWKIGATLSPDILLNLKQSVLVTSTGASTRIEGAKLSDEEVEKLMRGLSIQKLAERDKQEVQGYYELLKEVFDAWENVRFGENAIKHFHKELLKYVEKDQRHCGEYKEQDNRVEMLDAEGKPLGIVFDPIPAYLTSKAMQELTEWTRNALNDNEHHPLLIIGAFIVEFLHIHPFTDGNGRLSRILTNLLLLQAGYAYTPYVSHEKLVEDNKTDYYLALRRSQSSFAKPTSAGATEDRKGEDIEAWLSFFLTVILKQSQMAVELLTQEHIELSLSPKQLLVYQCLTKNGELTAGDIAQKTDIARPTVNQALRKLLGLKAIRRVGEGSTTRYRIT